MMTIPPATNSSSEVDSDHMAQPAEVVNVQPINEKTASPIQVENIKTDADVESLRQLDEEEKQKKLTRSLRIRIARELTARIRVMPDGSRTFIRFSTGEINEHWILLISFSILGFTGLLQRYSKFQPVTWSINNIFGGLETLRSLHHMMAFLLGLLVIYHTLRVAYLWFVKRIRVQMLPEIRDIHNFTGTIAYNLNKRKSRPLSDRYTIEQKMEYWMLAAGIAVLGITGLIQWFPSLVTLYLPGNTIPIARLAHSLQAVLSVSIVIVWHMYNAVIKEHNSSVFDGLMTEKEIKEKHPIEYYRILKAQEFLKGLKTKQPATVQTQKAKVDEPVVQVNVPAVQPDEPIVQHTSE
jgi:formate dehydrogenase gamma subunit